MRRFLLAVKARGKQAETEATFRGANAFGQLGSQYAEMGEASRSRALGLKEQAFGKISGALTRRKQERAQQKAQAKQKKGSGGLGAAIGTGAGAVIGGILAIPTGGASLGVPLSMMAGDIALGAVAGGGLGGALGTTADIAMGEGGSQAAIQQGMNTALWTTQWAQANPRWRDLGGGGGGRSDTGRGNVWTDLDYFYEGNEMPGYY